MTSKELLEAEMLRRHQPKKGINLSTCFYVILAEMFIIAFIADNVLHLTSVIT
jgi:hypothetical protein